MGVGCDTYQDIVDKLRCHREKMRKGRGGKRKGKEKKRKEREEKRRKKESVGSAVSVYLLDPRVLYQCIHLISVSEMYKCRSAGEFNPL